MPQLRTLRDLQTIPSGSLKQSVRGLTKTFVYTSAPVAVAAITGTVLGTTQTRINIDGDAHFILTGLSGKYLLSTNLEVQPQLFGEPEVQVQEEGTGYLLFDRPLRWGLVIGTGKRTFPVRPAYFFRSRSTALLTFNNPETVAYNVTISLSGYKLYLK